jgi:hypothetical protein
MDFMYAFAEAIVIAFVFGAIMGGVVATHLRSRQASTVKVKSKRQDWV